MKNLSKRSKHSMKYRAFHLEAKPGSDTEYTIRQRYFLYCSVYENMKILYYILIFNEDIPMTHRL